MGRRSRLRIAMIGRPWVWAGLAGWLALAGCASEPGPRLAPSRMAPLVADKVAGLGDLAQEVVIVRDDAPLPPLIATAFEARPTVDFLLLGEIHDHALQHRLRLHWLEALARQHRFVLALEQFDARDQPALDVARQALFGPGSPIDPAAVRRLAKAGGFDFDGWYWPFYEPYVALALRHDLPIVAANLSNAQARRIARGEQPAPAGARPVGWSASEDAAMAAAIRDGHCGLLPERLIAPMALAQQARDARIADVLLGARRRLQLPVVLLAGNGHVRKDLGVPRHRLAALPGTRIISVGFVETRPAPGAFDLVVLLPRQSSTDPCESIRARPDTG